MESTVLSTQAQHKMTIKKASAKKEDVPVFLMKVSTPHYSCLVGVAFWRDRVVAGGNDDGSTAGLPTLSKSNAPLIGCRMSIQNLAQLLSKFALEDVCRSAPSFALFFVFSKFFFKTASHRNMYLSTSLVSPPHGP